MTGFIQNPVPVLLLLLLQYVGHDNSYSWRGLAGWATGRCFVIIMIKDSLIRGDMSLEKIHVHIDNINIQPHTSNTIHDDEFMISV